MKEKLEIIKYLQQEIDRQKEIIRQLDIKNLELTTIIKEVREYIENPRHEMSVTTYQRILEILDKVGDEK